LGTDSAPHVDKSKESSCGCAGIYTASNSISCLAEVFDRADALDKLEGFTSIFGAGFYGLAPNQQKITLNKDLPVIFPQQIKTDDGPITLFNPNIDIHWKVTSYANNIGVTLT
jgi:dihydroorotase